MIEASARIAAMNDRQLVRYFEAFSQHLLAGMTTSFDEVRSGITSETRALPGWDQIDNLTAEQASETLSVGQAAESARSILLQMATNESFGPVLESHLAGYRDDELVVETILAVGLVATVLLIVSSTRFEYRDGKGSFIFNPNPKNVETILAPFSEALKRLPGGG